MNKLLQVIFTALLFGYKMLWFLRRFKELLISNNNILTYSWIMVLGTNNMLRYLLTMILNDYNMLRYLLTRILNDNNSML